MNASSAEVPLPLPLPVSKTAWVSKRCQQKRTEEVTGQPTANSVKLRIVFKIKKIPTPEKLQLIRKANNDWGIVELMQSIEEDEQCGKAYEVCLRNLFRMTKVQTSLVAEVHEVERFDE